MKIRRTQVVLITFAVASWFAAVLELGASVGSGVDECLEHGINCAEASATDRGPQGTLWCEGQVCWALESGNGASTCRNAGTCP